MAKKPEKTWVYAPKKPPKVKVPVALKAAATAEASEFIEKVLKPKHLQPPPRKPRFNYVIDVWSRWHGSYFYFGATYACPGPDALSPTFETKFVRLEYLGGKRFTLPTCDTRRSGSPLTHGSRWISAWRSSRAMSCSNREGEHEA